MKTWNRFVAGAGAVCLLGASANAQVRITEWQYNNSEFIEFTNLGGTPVDFTGWSFDDDSRIPGSVSLSAFGTVQPGESVVLAEVSAEAFRAGWGLPDTVKVIGGNTVNLGRADEINIFDASNALVDRLTYGDEDFAGSIRTLNDAGGPTSDAVLGTNNVLGWAFVNSGGNPHGVPVLTHSAGYTGNPGSYVPEPASLSLLGLAGMALGRRRRR